MVGGSGQDEGRGYSRAEHDRARVLLHRDLRGDHASRWSLGVRCCRPSLEPLLASRCMSRPIQAASEARGVGDKLVPGKLAIPWQSGRLSVCTMRILFVKPKTFNSNSFSAFAAWSLSKYSWPLLTRRGLRDLLTRSRVSSAKG